MELILGGLQGAVGGCSGFRGENVDPPLLKFHQIAKLPRSEQLLAAAAAPPTFEGLVSARLGWRGAGAESVMSCGESNAT